MHVPYTASMAPSLPTADELRQRIPGWGVDRDPADRPAVPRERLDLDIDLGGAAPRADGIPDRQPETMPRERSIEHAALPPVFGTVCPPKGASGAVRRLAYRRYSEGRAAHWLLLVAADRVDAWEEHLRSLASTRPDNPITQTGLRAELTRGGWSSRVGRRRADLAHQPLDPVIVAGPWIAVAGAAFLGARRVARAIAR
jgi:hypothetical protein